MNVLSKFYKDRTYSNDLLFILLMLYFMNIRTFSMKPNDDQNNYLINYMLTHSIFAAHQIIGINGKEDYKKRWKTLAENLNKLGEPRSLESWMEVTSFYIL